MGCYDTVILNCPKVSCNETIYAQSKSGECLLREYPLALAPVEVLYDVNRHAPFKCPVCGTEFSVQLTIEKKMAWVEKDVVIDRKVITHR